MEMKILQPRHFLLCLTAHDTHRPRRLNGPVRPEADKGQLPIPLWHDNGARHKTEIGATKRKKVRTVDFCDTLAAILRRAKKEQIGNRLRYGDGNGSPPAPALSSLPDGT